MTPEPLVDATGKPIGLYNPVCVRAFWGPRRDDATQVAQQLITCMNQLVQINNADRWMVCGADENGLLDEPFENEQQVQRWVQGRVMTDEDRPPKPIPEWGFQLRTRIMRGTHSVMQPDGGVGDYDLAGNYFIIKGPEWLMGYPSEYARSHIITLVESWSPTWTAWHTYSEFKSQHAERNTIQFGPVTYVAGIDPAQLSAHLPSTASATALHEGTLITLGNGPQDYRYDDIYLVRDAVQQVRGSLAYR